MSSTPTANIYTILTHYALKQNNPLIHFNEFCEYMRRYSQRYLEQQEELIKYVKTNGAKRWMIVIKRDNLMDLIHRLYEVASQC